MSTSNDQLTFNILTYNTHLFEGSAEVLVLQSLMKTLENLPDAIKAIPVVSDNIESWVRKLLTIYQTLTYRDKDRAQAICEKIINLDSLPDIICLQEVWGESFRPIFLNALYGSYRYHYITQPYEISDDDIDDVAKIFKKYLGVVEENVWSMILSLAKILLGKNAPSLTNGLIVLSNRPLTNCNTILYDRTKINDNDLEDRLGKKGFITFNIMNPDVRIGTTHMPTSPNDVKSLILNPAKIILKDSWPSAGMFLGDLNIHYYNQNERNILDIINSDLCNPSAQDIVALMLPLVADSYTIWSGCTLSEMLRLRDDPSPSIKAPDAENIILEEHAKTNADSWDRVDYIYFSQASIKAKNLNLDSVKVLSEWTISDSAVSNGQLDLADHRPILATFKFTGEPKRDIYFGLTHQYGNGIQTSVAINNGGDILEVHKSESFDTLWFHTGKTDKMVVIWNSSNKYDNGQTPSVALNDDGLVVEAHQSEGNAGLWYHVGQLTGGSIIFGRSVKYDNGITPSVALNKSNWCVEVHQSEGNSGLWYHVGQVNSSDKTINWGSSHKYDEGNGPRVCLNNNGIIVEVHKSESFDTLWYHVGVIDKATKMINWGSSYQYDKGVEPTIAITDDGFVIELHKSQNHDTLWRKVGMINVDNKTITFSDSLQFDNGKTPSVACALNGSIGIQTHQSESFTTLWSSTLKRDARAS